jgi:16S rRNA (uracil1498-N3)-methyltransferase
VVQKLTELGVDRIIPLVADRSVVRRSGPRAEHALARMRRAAREAAAQSRRSWLPEVTEQVTLSAFARAVESAGGHPALAELGGDPPSLERPVVAVGPEGGWSDAERARCEARVGLGDAVLRATLLAGLRSALVAGAGHQP